MPRLLPLLIAVWLVPTCLDASAAPTSITDAALVTASALRERALRDNVAYEITEGLTTEIGARLAGGPNDAKARDLMMAKFKALGFDKVWSEPVTFPKWVRRSEHAEILAPFPQPLAVTALGNSAATVEGGVSAEVVSFESLDALQAADGATVSGKIVYIGTTRMQARVDGRDYGKGSAVRTRGPSLAAQKGAAAFLLRSVGSDDNRTPHTGVTTFADGVQPIPAAALSNPDADLLDAMLKRGRPVSIRLALDCGVEGEYVGANVIGEISGRSKPDEYFLTGGHLDSWDLGTGAIDDAAGVAITTAAAHLIAQLPKRPLRSIRVVAFANEEAGLFGGTAYADKHRKQIGKAILGAESDGGGGCAECGGCRRCGRCGDRAAREWGGGRGDGCATTRRQRHPGFGQGARRRGGGWCRDKQSRGRSPERRRSPASAGARVTARSRPERPLGRREPHRGAASFSRDALSDPQGHAPERDPVLSLRADIERQLHHRHPSADVERLDCRRWQCRGLQVRARRRRLCRAARARRGRRSRDREGLPRSEG